MEIGGRKNDSNDSDCLRRSCRYSVSSVGCNVGKEFLAEVEVNEMALEKPSYRDNLERIKEVYPNKEMLNVKNVATFCGLNRKTVLELFGFNKGYISVAKLAREMS